ncbi:hypothetical protein R3P38DRAFT_3612086 [Favolaschia claudopus]|uniref:Uncharacterized protein n=1 Tax=Favolaschia claudopus TaxID=2862362 RepID=A0AAW0A6J6_9AGAR
MRGVIAPAEDWRWDRDFCFLRYAALCFDAALSMSGGMLSHVKDHIFASSALRIGTPTIDNLNLAYTEPLLRLRVHVLLLPFHIQHKINIHGCASLASLNASGIPDRPAAASSLSFALHSPSGRSHAMSASKPMPFIDGGLSDLRVLVLQTSTSGTTDAALKRVRCRSRGIDPPSFLVWLGHALSGSGDILQVVHIMPPAPSDAAIAAGYSRLGSLSLPRPTQRIAWNLVMRSSWLKPATVCPVHRRHRSPPLEFWAERQLAHTEPSSIAFSCSAWPIRYTNVLRPPLEDRHDASIALTLHIPVLKTYLPFELVDQHVAV